MSPAITAFLHNYCPVCSSDLSQPKSLLDHLKTQHQIVLPARKTGYNRKKDPAYEFIKNLADCQVEHYACPSCWNHYSEPHELEKHFQVHMNNQGGDSSMGESGQHQDAHEEYDEEAALGSNDRKGTSEDEKDTEYLQKSNELFNTLDELITGFKKLLPYGYKNEKGKNTSR
ncbi:unnamed protein product [Mucor fragilis]